jgi:hypothetical protein
MDDPLIPAEAQRRYPALATDFEVLAEELLPSFVSRDAEAIWAQRRFRAEQLLLIGGGVVATGLGAVQASLGGASWAAIAEAVVAGILAGVAGRAGSGELQRKY